jgi:hypothetical protein
LKRRSGSPEARNTELDDECSELSTQIDEQEAMFAEWELSHDQRRVDCKEEHDRVLRKKEARAADKIAFFFRSKRWWKLRIEACKESKEWLKFALSTKDVIRRQEDIIADLEMTIQLQKLVGKATDVLKADPVAKKQKTEPRKTKGSWGGARRGPDFEAKCASSGTAEQKGAKGKLLGE